MRRKETECFLISLACQPPDTSVYFLLLFTPDTPKGRIILNGVKKVGAVSQGLVESDFPDKISVSLFLSGIPHRIACRVDYR